MIRLSHIHPLVLIFAGTLLFLSACSSGHDHESPLGFRLSVGNEPLLVQDEGVVTYLQTDNALEVSSGGNLGPVILEFISEEGNYYTPDPDKYSLRFTVADTPLLAVDYPFNNDNWTFRLRGLQTGSTSFQIDLWHGSHADFTSRPLTVDIIE